MSLTTDPTDPRLKRGIDTETTGQNEVYLVLSEEERSKGFVRPYRDAYKHIGVRPAYQIRPITSEEQERYKDQHYVAFEAYPTSELPSLGRFWTQAQLDNKGCGTITTMGIALAETYARDPHFYGATYCCHCRKHLPVAEFIWLDGQTVGS